MNAESLLLTGDLKRYYQRGSEVIKALDGVSVGITVGEFVCITGPSGSGKSTLLYILGMLDRQTSGDYYFKGQLTNNLTQNERARVRNRSIGFVFQNFYLLPRATALRNVVMPLEYTTRSDLRRIRYSSDEQKELAKQVLVRVGLGDRLYHKSNELSGGQRQRVAIARALINNPPVILADEPTGNLDSRSADQIMQLFMSLLEEGRTVVMVTHNLEFLPYTSRHIVMRDGRVVDDQRLK